MKIIMLALLATGALLFSGCEEYREHHHRDAYRGGAYGGYDRSYGHGEYRGYPDYRGAPDYQAYPDRRW